MAFVKDKILLYLFVSLVIVNIYFISAFLVARPSEKFNRAIDNSTGTIKIKDELLYPKGTLLYFSENEKINNYCFRVYWPLCKFLESRELVYFQNTQRKAEK